MKLSVIYDSRTGNTKRCAEWIAAGMSRVACVEAKTFSTKDVDEAFVKESAGVVIGSPSYYALMTADMRTWLLEGAPKLSLGGKLGGAFATVQYTHGGGDLVIQSILTNLITIGMLCYSGGGACGDPCIHLGPVAVNHNVEKACLEDFQENFQIFGERFAKKAKELFG